MMFLMLKIFNSLRRWFCVLPYVLCSGLISAPHSLVVSFNVHVCSHSLFLIDLMLQNPLNPMTLEDWCSRDYWSVFNTLWSCHSPIWCLLFFVTFGSSLVSFHGHKDERVVWMSSIWWRDKEKLFAIWVLVYCIGHLYILCSHPLKGSFCCCHFLWIIYQLHLI